MEFRVELSKVHTTLADSTRGAVTDEDAWLACTDPRLLLWYAEKVHVPAQTLAAVADDFTLELGTVQTQRVAALKVDARAYTKPIYTHELAKTCADDLKRAVCLSNCAVRARILIPWATIDPLQRQL